ncbi:hypothetical protein [Massilia sp. DD77]|uniref:hypothetical protein n=1 Tax=Massilia sp. DD77 TaxID=3109349 RepID=UPI002FFFB7A4
MRNNPPSSPAAAPASAPAAPDRPGGGLSSADQVVELADQLSSCADQLHERIVKEIRSHQGGSVPEKVQQAMRELLEDEILLRQRANGLYADAATVIVKGLGKPQSHLLALTADAAEKIRKIGLIGEVTTLVAGLLAFAGAVTTGQPAPILLALEKIHKQIKLIEAQAPKPPAGPA